MLLNQAVLALRQSDMARWQHLVPLPVLRQDGVVVTLEEAAVGLPPWLHHREVAETVALLAFMRGGPLVDTYGNMRRITNGRRLVWQWSLRDPDNSGAVADGSACLRLVDRGPIHVGPDVGHVGLDAGFPVSPEWPGLLANWLYGALDSHPDLWMAARDSVRPRARQGAPATGMDYVLEQAMAATWFPRLQEPPEPTGDGDVPVVTLRDALPLLPPGVSMRTVAEVLAVLALVPGGPLLDERLRPRRAFAGVPVHALQCRVHQADGPCICLTRGTEPAVFSGIRRLLAHAHGHKWLAKAVDSLAWSIAMALAMDDCRLWRWLRELRTTRYRRMDTMLAGIPTNSTTEENTQ